jgi:hypothetical protein
VSFLGGKEGIDGAGAPAQPLPENEKEKKRKPTTLRNPRRKTHEMTTTTNNETAT